MALFVGKLVFSKNEERTNNGRNRFGCSLPDNHWDTRRLPYTRVRTVSQVPRVFLHSEVLITSELRSAKSLMKSVEMFSVSGRKARQKRRLFSNGSVLGSRVCRVLLDN